MMRLALALYAEGDTDDRFLSLIIQRTSRKILAEHEQKKVDVAPIELIKLREKKRSRDENILQAARQAVRYSVLIVHSDADGPSQEKALKERILPGFNLVQRSPTVPVCKSLLPIIPIQAIEAWILADHEILRAELRTDLSADELGIPEKVRHVESISRPKIRLKDVVSRVNRQLRPHQRIDMNSLYEPLGKNIRLERLNQLEAYRQFVKDLTVTLKILKLIP